LLDPSTSGPSARVALDTTENSGVDWFDRLVNHLFGSGLRLSRILSGPETNAEVSALVCEVLEELDRAMAEVQDAALAVAVGGHAPPPSARRHPRPVQANDGADDEVVRTEERGVRRRLRRVDDAEVFAYAARGSGFVRASDHMLWAHERDGWLLSARSGTPLAHRLGNVFYDRESNVPLYYEDTNGVTAPVRDQDDSR
jgi:hypothetical protein